MVFFSLALRFSSPFPVHFLCGYRAEALSLAPSFSFLDSNVLSFWILIVGAMKDDKSKQKALKTVSTLSGIDSISMDMNERKLTVIGTVDPVKVVSKLRKLWPTDIISVGPAVEPEKEEPKKEETKKEEEQNMEEKKEEPKKEEEEKKKEPDHVLELVKTYKQYNPHMTTYYYVQSMEENPNACVIS